MDQVVWRWALLERGMVQSILGVAGEATNRRYSPLIAAAHVTWNGGGASNQNAVRLGLGQWTNDEQGAPAGTYRSVAALQSAIPVAAA